MSKIIFFKMCGGQEVTFDKLTGFNNPKIDDERELRDIALMVKKADKRIKGFTIKDLSEMSSIELLSQTNFESPIKGLIPQREIRGFSISHAIEPEDKTWDVISMRTAIMRGCSPHKVRYDSDRTVTVLNDKNGKWMSDVPIELESHIEVAAKCKGNVLVGGLGLGIICKYLQRNPEVKNVHVIEISQAVISLVWRQLDLDRRFSIIQADITDYLNSIEERTDDYYTCCYLDTWRADSETEFIETVLPLKRLAMECTGLDGDHITCWMEDVMLGQIRHNLLSNCMIPERFEKFAALDDEVKEHLKSKWGKIYASFWQKVKADKLTLEDAATIVEDYIRWVRLGMLGEFIPEVEL